MSREESHSDLERFFFELAPRLETARALDRELDQQLARRFNVLDYLRTDELGLSRVVKDLLNPEGNHGQGTVFLQLLLDKLEFKVDGKIDDSQVDVELTIGDKGRLDVAVRIDERHCLAIENKPYAADQPNQVKGYLEWLKQYDKHMLIYLSPTGEGPEKHSIEEADLAKLGEHDGTRRFVIMPYHQAADLDDRFDRFRLPFSLTDWLADCRRDCDVDRLRWFLREAETFCRRQFGGNTMTTAEDSAFEEFVLGNHDRVETAIAVHKSWTGLKEKVYRRFLEKIQGNLCKDMKHFCPEVKFSVVYGEKPYRSHVNANFNLWSNTTCIFLQNQAEGPSRWGIGVYSPLILEERGNQVWSQLNKELAAELKDCGEPPGKYYSWWKFVREEYQDLDSLIPEIRRESQNKEGGEIMRYFVEEFVRIAKIAIPIINRIEGGKS